MTQFNNWKNWSQKKYIHSLSNIRYRKAIRSTRIFWLASCSFIDSFTHSFIHLLFHSFREHQGHCSPRDCEGHQKHGRQFSESKLISKLKTQNRHRKAESNKTRWNWLSAWNLGWRGTQRASTSAQGACKGGFAKTVKFDLKSADMFHFVFNRGGGTGAGGSIRAYERGKLWTK